jgi:uncharacterized protein
VRTPGIRPARVRAYRATHTANANLAYTHGWLADRPWLHGVDTVTHVQRSASPAPPPDLGGLPRSQQSATLEFHMLKIDVFPHILPRPFYDRLLQVAPSSGLMVKRVQNIPVMIDLDRRFEVMDRHEGYMQVLTLSAPPLENVAGSDLSPELAKLANDEMAKLVERYPDRFPGFVASLPMNNPDAAMREIDRAIDQLGATGVQLFTNVNGEPLDKPEYLQLFERMAAIDLPIWMHPARTASFPDYVGEPRSKFDLWWAFGWPYETGTRI